MITEKSINNEILTIETLTETDIHDVVRLSNLLERGYAESEIRMILQAGNLFGHRSGEGTIVSTAAILPYQGNLASLGVVMVDPRYRRRGLATRLVQTCLDIVPEYSVILVATDEGKPLYEKLGFRTVDTLHRLIAGEYQCQRPTHLQMQYTQFRYIDDQDLPELLKLDQEAFGAGRSKFLNLWLRQANYTSILQTRLAFASVMRWECKHRNFLSSVRSLLSIHGWLTCSSMISLVGTKEKYKLIFHLFTKISSDF